MRVDDLPKDLTKEKLFSAINDEQADALLHDWEFWARPEQLGPGHDNWQTWLYLAGRGAGKTRTGAEWVRRLVKKGYKRGAIIVPVYGEIEKIILRGESGIMRTCWHNDYDDAGDFMGMPIKSGNPPFLKWANGAICELIPAFNPERVRGLNVEFIWCDELCSWKYPEAFDLAMMALRIGDNPRCFVSTTPKPTPLLKKIMENDSTFVTRGTTYDNQRNLSPKFFESVVSFYEGSKLGRQELLAEVLDQSESALWNRNILDATRVASLAGITITRHIVAVDPAITNTKTSDETGIVVVALSSDGHGYVIEDGSGRYSPAEWAEKVKSLYDKYSANMVVAEGNQGGDMVRHTLQGVGSHLPVRIVHASKGKIARAEPISAFFEKGKCHIVGSLPLLEEQLCTWEPSSGKDSPDRLDAMVWGLTDIMLRKEARQGQLLGFY